MFQIRSGLIIYTLFNYTNKISTQIQFSRFHKKNETYCKYYLKFCHYLFKSI
jgi:hypothetical protein